MSNAVVKSPLWPKQAIVIKYIKYILKKNHRLSQSQAYFISQDMSISLQ